jgi:8-oxo-dGTP pyrophosphatase MutT (NUDIX family)
MSEPRWHPSVTVAAVIARDGRYLMVEELTPEGLKLNQPAGHLDPGESLLQAVVREAREETACDFAPEALLGVYQARFRRPGQDVTYLRFAFRGTAGDPVPGRALDPPIVRTLWLTAEEIRARLAEHRSPLVMRCVDDHRAGRRLPLDALWAADDL